ncbi:hypothetical protein [Spirosoma areae]
MRRRLNPWAVAITAALTFGSLMAFVGPRSFGNHHWGRHGYYDQHYRYNHGGCDGYRGDRDKAKTDSVSVQ